MDCLKNLVELALFNVIYFVQDSHNCTEILIQISVQLFYAKRLYSTRFREKSRFLLL